MTLPNPLPEPTDFLRENINADLASGRYDRVHTRFPPEPNGYLHIGHAKAICISFGIARDYGGMCNLRFDDTNPTKEEVEYVDSIMEDVRWLGFDWEDRLYYASDYFDQLYDWAEKMIQAGQAFVCDLTADEMREHRGTLTSPGRNSRFRDRTIEENLELFRRMKAGEFPDGSRTLRAKIDMASPNLNMRDPVMYRILHATHHRTGDKWCIYPTYDYTHGQSDSLEDHALDLYAGVREPPPAVRLVHQDAGHFPFAADGVRPAEHHLHDDEQAAALGAGAGEDRQRLGRPADADDLRIPAPRLHARSDPHILRDDRRGEGR